MANSKYRNPDGTEFAYKADAVEYVWKSHKDIRKWYREEHDFDASDVTVQSAMTYGRGGHGDICDMILSDANVEFIG